MNGGTGEGESRSVGAGPPAAGDDVRAGGGDSRGAAVGTRAAEVDTDVAPASPGAGSCGSDEHPPSARAANSTAASATVVDPVGGRWDIARSLPRAKGCARARVRRILSAEGNPAKAESPHATPPTEGA
ncbi:hypothetical protein GCM10009832_30530 [Dietzia kunjamensis subsp. schimae]